jgi:Y-X(10)_GDL-associated radical SAM protein
MPEPERGRSAADFLGHVPVYVVWEITLACDLKCAHCGSRAGLRRPNELSTAECLEIIESVARLGTREVTIIGGEAYLRNDWLELIRAIRNNGMRCTMQTGGRNLHEARLAAAAEAGLNGIGVSVDGLAPLHDKLRGVPGSFDKAVAAIKTARALGMAVGCNTQIGAKTMADLPALMEVLIDAGASHWQIQLTVAMGNAVDNDSLLLQPHQIGELMPLLARLYKSGVDRGLLMIPGNNIGYFGPYEHVMRGFGDDRVHWTGCAAGQNTIGIEADGVIKGCPSLRTNGYAGGNIRETTLEDIWNHSEAMHFGRLRSVDDLWGFCRTCYYADVCRAGCTWTADSLFGKPGNNPYCHYRVVELEKCGLRERVVKQREAPDSPFAIGLFDLILEPIPGRKAAPPPHELAPPKQANQPPRGALVQLSPPARSRSTTTVGRIPPKLALCRACNQYIYSHEITCPHCQADVAQAARQHEETIRQRRLLVERLESLLGA